MLITIRYPNTVITPAEPIQTLHVNSLTEILEAEWNDYSEMCNTVAIEQTS